jgi:glycosyltransferase involved in cell wall biosynthesis
MSNILIISAVFPPEPVVSAQISESITINLSENHSVTVICPRPTRPLGYAFCPDKTKNYHFRKVVVSSYVCPQYSILGRMYESYSFGKYCSNFINKNRQNIDIIYVNAWPLFSQYLIVKSAKKYKIPVVLHAQDIYPEAFTNKILFFGKIINRFLLPIDKFILQNTKTVIAISDKMKNYLVVTRKIDENRIKVIQNWQDEREFIGKNTKKINHKSFTFMYLGNIGPVAGVGLLADAFLDAKIDNSRLVIAGSGSMKNTLVQKYKHLQNIDFLEVPQGKVADVQTQADVLLLPIKAGAALSSVPSKLPAYMFSRKPIITCVDDNSDTAETIVRANCGWVIKPESSEALAQIMANVVQIPIMELQTKGENGYNYALQHFSKTKNLQKLISIIENSK